MSRVMMIVGIVLVAIGIALMLMVFFSTSSIVAWGLTPEMAAIIIVGGIVSVGFSGVISALEGAGDTAWSHAGHAAGAAIAADELSPEVKQTIEALDEAKQDIEGALSGESAASEREQEEDSPDESASEEPAEDAAAEAAEEQASDEEKAAEEEQLYVVEERFIRNRPARILSDGTVEAETEEGWMRFENLEHLDEYLDAVTPQA